MNKELEELMQDIAKDYYIEYTEDDLDAMEKDFYNNKRERVIANYKEFIEESKLNYDYEEREEYVYGR